MNFKKNIVLVVALVVTLFAILGCKSEITVDPLDGNFIVFYSDTEFTVTPGNLWSYYDVDNNSFSSDNSILECSTDNNNWVKLDSQKDLKQTAVKSGDKYYLYFRGTGINSLTKNDTALSASWSMNGNNIYCKGNIENLLDYKAVSRGEHPPMGYYCFAFMFQDCTALVSAPELPATVLSDYCYACMFMGCKNLNSITCLATDINASYCLTEWLKDTAATGTFTKAKDVNIWTVGDNVPNGWTITE